MELRYCDQCGDVIRIEGTAPLEATASFVCDRCKAGGPKSAAGPRAAPGGSIQGGDLNLFSTKTIAIHKQRNEATRPADGRPKSSRLRLVKPGSTGTATSPQGTAAPSMPGSAAATAGQGASPPAQRLLFGCLHCRAPLSIRPVDRTSKLTCPHCHNVIYVTAGGQISKSIRIGRAPVPDSAASMPMVGSVRIRESAVLPAAEGAPGIAPPGVGLRGSSSVVRQTPRPGSSAARASAFDSRGQSGDPEKTDFIAAEKKGFRGQEPRVFPRKTAASSERLACDESDLLEEALEVASSLNQPEARCDIPAGKPAAAPQEAAEGNKAGLTKRVIKALFKP